MTKTIVKNKMTRKQARIAIAKDVLSLLNNRHLKVEACNGYITDICSISVPELKKVKIDEQVQPIINKIVRQCRVCALGASMISFVRLFNNTSFEELGMCNNELLPDYYDIVYKLSKVFKIEQLNMIETAFEGYNVMNNQDIPDNVLNKCIEFGEKYTSDRQRLIAIMKNIVENDGIFKP